MTRSLREGRGVRPTRGELRRFKRGGWRGSRGMTAERKKEWTLHFSDSILGSKSLLRSSILFIGLGKSGWSKFCSDVESS